MSALFPGSLPLSGSALTTQTLAVAGHTALHNNGADESRAIATKVGMGSSTPTANTFLHGTGAGTSGWAQVDLSTADVINTLPVSKGGTGTTTSTGSGSVVLGTSPTIATPTISNPTITGGGSWAGSPTLSTPAIADHTNAQHDHSNVVNGGSLGASTVNTTQLVDDAVTAAKMQYGIIRNRQGSTTGDNSWATAGTNNTDTSAKAVFMQSGVVTSSAGGATAVIFPTAYTQVPQVFVTVLNGAGTGFWANVNNVPTTTGFEMVAWSATASLAAKDCAWLSIGQ